jgi:NTE family protein
MVQIGVVLGAGGIVGAAYHAAVLTALAEFGFDARDAEVLVGTSAGAGVAATLRAGFPPIDLAPRTLAQPISDEAAAIVGRTGGPPTIEMRPRPLSRVPRPASPNMVLRSGGRPGKVFAALTPTGTIPTDIIGERIGMLYGDLSWPDRTLWICAVDLDSGNRVVFGRHGVDAPVGVAVQASSSIPGFFRPVDHAGQRYVDGAIHSPTNADLLTDEPLDLVVIVSPMSETRGRRTPSLPGLRGVHARQLASEVKQIRDAGTDVVTFQPTPDDVAAMGRNAMDATRREATTEVALASARKRLGDPKLADRLATLRRASS